MEHGTGSRKRWAEPLISKGQIQLIKIGQKELGMEDEDYRELLMNMFRVSSCTQLTQAQATKLIEHFGAIGFALRGASGSARSATAPARWKGARTGGKVVHLASQAELNKITALSYLVEWRRGDGLKRWLDARFAIKKVRTAREAFKVIEGLKGMIVNQMDAKYGKRWWEVEFADEGIKRFVREHGPKA